MHAVDTVVSDDVERVRAHQQAGDESPYLVHMRRFDGSTFLAECWGKAAPYEGKLARITTLRDLAEQEQAAAALRESEARYRALIAALGEGIVLQDADGSIRTCNASAERILGLSADQMMGRASIDPQWRAIHEDGTRFLYTEHPALVTLRSGKPCTNVIMGVHKPDGTLTWIAVNSQPLVHNQATEPYAVVCSFADITEQKHLERMKNEFVSTVSHELRTPLTSIHGSLGLIACSVAGDIPARVQTMVEVAYRNSERLIRLINDILDIEKIETGKMVFDLQPVDLLALVEQALAANRAYGQQFNVTFVLQNAADRVWVYADGDRLIQALTNLLANAAKFSPSGDQVIIALSRQADSIRIAISDHGPGIPESFHERLFQKFAQADSSDTRQKGGTGLGLSITKAIVEHLGGRIDFETLPGTGTTFYLDLPELRGPAPTSASLYPPAIQGCEADRDWTGAAADSVNPVLHTPTPTTA
jgi:PAS domain S-box-containing protein